ncbi:MAG: restriction endonuclease subunit S [Akkermansiaceae bacterium]
MAPPRETTKTGGRSATTRTIPGEVALSVGETAMSTPDGWRWRKLTDIARLESGHTPSRKHPEYWDGDIPWIGIRDATRNHGKRIADTIQHTNELGIANSSARILPENTVCLSRTASVGYVIVMGRPMATSQDFVNWVCSEKLNPEFLRYLLLAERDSFLRFASGATHQTIYFPEVKAFHICYPPLPEQERIVAILDEALEGIATATAHAERNLHNARELFQSVLQSTFEQKGEDWVKTTLGDATGGVSTGPFGSLLHKKDYVENGIPLVNPAHITDTGIEPDSRKTVSLETSERLSSYSMSVGDIVIGRRGEMGRCAVVTTVEDGWLCGTGSFFIKPSEKAIPDFLVSYLRSDGCRERLESIAGGAVMKNLSNTALSNFVIPLPPVEEQKAIVQKLDALATEIRRLEAVYQRKLDALAELKQSLLQRAFAGEL